MPTPIQWAALRLALTRSRAFRLRPCATVSEDFAGDKAVSHLLDRVFVFAVVLITAVMASVITWHGGSPLLAVEVVAGGGVAAATIIGMLRKTG